MTQYTHIELAEREQIQKALGAGQTIAAIARSLSRDPKSIAHEIKTNRQAIYKGGFGTPRNDCSKRIDCRMTYVCGSCIKGHNRRCASCDLCNSHCPEFEAASCKRLVKAPYCCNGCEKDGRCPQRRYLYRADYADMLARARLSDSRKGMLLSDNDLDDISDLLEPVRERGQSVHHIYVNHADRFPCSERSIYKLIDANLVGIRRIDLPEAVKRRPRRKKPMHRVDRRCFEGRTYNDFLAYMDQHPAVSYVEMDTIESVEGDRSCLLTLCWTQSIFGLALACESQTAREVSKRLQELHSALGEENFIRLFPVILTDRGSEFSNPAELEALGTRIFYCDPMQSTQKPHVERWNREVRCLIPKGYSFEGFGMDDARLVTSHVNSYTSLGLGNRTPYNFFSYCFGQAILSAFGITRIPPDDVMRSPRLLAGKIRKIEKRP